MAHCRRFISQPLNRREMLSRCANGFGAIALTSLMANADYGGHVSAAEQVADDPFSPRPTDFPPKVKHVIYLYMDGGPSQVDTFDPKPLLTKENGKPFAMKKERTQFNNNGNTLGSPWKFKQYGKSGIPVSDLFPHVAQHVDDLAVIRSMTSNFSEHTNANYFLHTGMGIQGRPSMGAWVGLWPWAPSAAICQDLWCSTAALFRPAAWTTSTAVFFRQRTKEASFPRAIHPSPMCAEPKRVIRFSATSWPF